MMGKQKFYVVWKGNNPGIYQSWEKCQNEIKNINGALFKSFTNLEEAKKAYDQGYEEYKQGLDYKNVLNGPELNSISVDAASSGNPGIMEYQGVDTNTKEILFKMGPFNNATNNIGEFLALVHGIAILEKKSDKKIIYSDSITAMSWVRKKHCQTKLKRNKENEEVFVLVERAITWLKENNYSIVIKKWDTKNWGEIPADFGRK
jgi:ribonuclease HI